MADEQRRNTSDVEPGAKEGGEQVEDLEITDLDVAGSVTGGDSSGGVIPNAHEPHGLSV
jgi:hypothetical protein